MPVLSSRSQLVQPPASHNQLVPCHRTPRCHINGPLLHPVQQQRCHRIAADAAVPSMSAAADRTAQQQQNVSIPVPLGPQEPPEEQPKKLSPHARLSETLASTSITIIGDNTELNWATCRALSEKIGWFPVATSKVLLGLHKTATLQEFIQKEGRQAVVESEAKVLKGMRDQLRCCIATLGDGAAADSTLYSNLFGTIIIWLDEQDKRYPNAATPARAVYQQQAEVRATLQKTSGGFGEKELSLDEKAQKATGQLVKAINQLLMNNSDLPVRKRLYVEYGCRGDWPELKPKEWNPVLEGFDRKPVV